jgi:uncharacterized membrane protein YeaQ/YmgE (transglycosylase-associated protein family)
MGDEEAAMRSWVSVLVLVVIGIVGAWAGCWIGHALGWSTNAEGGDRRADDAIRRLSR